MKPWLAGLLYLQCPWYPEAVPSYIIHLCWLVYLHFWRDSDSQQQMNKQRRASFVDKDLLLGLRKHFQKDHRFQLPMEKKTLLALYWWSCVASPSIRLFSRQWPSNLQGTALMYPAPIQPIIWTLSLCIKWNCAHNSHSWTRPLTSLGPLKCCTRRV